MLDFLMLMILPLIIAVAVLLIFKGKVTIAEFFGQLGIVAVFIGICLAVTYRSSTMDTEVWNGQVTSREHHHVSCTHSYSCNCTTDSKGHESCDTCYQHPYDVDWEVHASTGEAIDIDRVDEQGLIEPKRWDEVYVGEPFSSTHTFTNYIRANPDSVLLGTKGNMGVPDIDMHTWNWLLAQANKTLGPTKQVNINLILVPTSDASYMLALKDAWFGGKKNDVDVVIGSLDGHKIEFASVMSWSTNADMGVSLQNDIEAIGTLDRRDAIVKAITTDVSTKFVRLHMRDMHYLMRSFQPSGTAMLWMFILSTLLSIGLAIWSVMNDITDDGSSSKYLRYNY